MATIRVQVSGAAPVEIETDHDHPEIAVYQDDKPVMGLLTESDPTLVIGHWPDGEEWHGLAHTDFPDQEWIDAEYDKGVRGARDLLRATRQAHRMVHNAEPTIEQVIEDFDRSVAEERRCGAWIVLYSDHHKRGFNDEAARIYRGLREEKSCA